MGAKIRVDEKLYNKVKKECKAPKDDKKVMAKFNLGQTTVRAIRNTKTYNMFAHRTRTSRKSRKGTRRYAINPKALKMAKKNKTPQEQAMTAWYAFVLLALLGGVIVVYLIIKWLLAVIFGV